MYPINFDSFIFIYDENIPYKIKIIATPLIKGFTETMVMFGSGKYMPQISNKSAIKYAPIIK